MAGITTLWIYNWFVTVLLFIIITILAKIQMTVRRKRKLMGNMPTYPGALPLIGHAHLATSFNYLSLINEMRLFYKENKEAAHIWLGPRVCGYVGNPADIENILNRKDALNKGQLFSFFQAHSTGLLNNAPPRWNRMRKMASIPLAHKQLMDSFVDTFKEQSQILLQALKSREGEYFDICPNLSNCAQDILYCAHFGVNLDIQHNTHLSAQDTVAKTSILVYERMMKAWLFPDFIYFRTKQGKTLRKCVDHNIHIAKLLIEQRRKILLEDNKEDKEDKLMTKVMDVYLDPKNGLTEVEIMDEVMDLILVGFEGISLIQSWVLLMLAMYPEHQEKIHRELDEILGDGEISLEALQKCQFLDMVSKEALRLFGLPNVIRRLENDVSIVKNYTIPAKSEIIVSFTLVHRDSRYWEHPDSFYPDHFLPENEASRPKYAFLPFGGGPRKCPAYGYGLIVIKFVAATLLRKYRFVTNKKFEDLQLDLYFLFKPRDGFFVKYEPRSPPVLT